MCRKKQTRKSSANRDQNRSYCPPNFSQRGSRPRSNYHVQADNQDGELFPVRSGIEGLLTVEVSINGKPTEMEIDTGASVSIMSEGTRSTKFPELQLARSTVRLKTYTNQPVEVLGEATVDVEYRGQQCQLRLVVVSGNGPTLFGRDWLEHLRLDWKEIHAVHNSSTLQRLLGKYEELYRGELGTVTVKEFKGKFLLRDEAQPRFCKARPVPFVIKEDVGRELDRLESDGVIQKIPHSQWASPIVPVPKSDGSYRLCGDYKQTLNPELNVNQYPLPKAEDLFTALAGGKRFIKLDISQAYLQIKLDGESSQCTTINTHQGLYKFTHLPSSAPALFQQLMDTVLQNLPHVICFIDDILITGVDDQDHLRNLNSVLSRLQERGFWLKKVQVCFHEGISRVSGTPD